MHEQSEKAHKQITQQHNNTTPKTTIRTNQHNQLKGMER